MVPRDDIKLLQKWVGIVISALSVWTIIGNVVIYQDKFSAYSIIEASISLALFVASVFVDKTWIRICQVVCIAIVAILSMTSEPDNILDVIAGCFFMLVAISLAFSYDFFDKNPVPLIIISLLSLTFAFSITSKNVATGAGIAFAFSAGCAILWAIIHVKVRRLQEIAKRAMDLAKRADPGDTHG